MPHVSKNANFSEKGIKNARLATLLDASVSCDQIFEPRKARILAKKREKKRQPKMSTFLLHF